MDRQCAPSTAGAGPNRPIRDQGLYLINRSSYGVAVERAPDSVDVAVIGCGPVGGVLATLLGLRGHRVAVVERHPARYPLPRAVHFDHEVARILQACGLGADLPALSEPGSEYEWRNGAGQVLLRFGGRPVGPSGWPDANMFWQPALEERIEAAAAALPAVDVWRGLRLVGLDDDGDGVDVLLDPGERLRARYVVGCDGANSTVRTLVDAPVTDLGFCFDWLIVDVVLHDGRTFDPVNVQVCEPARPTTMVSGGPGRRRWEFMRLPGETVEELDDEARAWELLAPWDVTPGNATLERHAVYRFQACWVDRWRTGRVLLAGDAAHLMPPFAGQGLCSGVRDAANLAWKLDLVLAGRAAPALLDAYEAERRDNVRAVIDLSIALGEVICVTDPEAAAARDAAMVAGVGPAQAPPPLPGVTAGVVRAGDPAAGHLFVQGRIAGADGGDGGGAPALCDDVVGNGWRLVTPDAALADALPPAVAAWFAGLGGRVVAVPPEVDVDGTYADWFAAHGVAAALQRPDFHVYGTAATPAGAAALLIDLRDALAASAVPAVPAPTPSTGGSS
jgi:2-polyprenyl-6-methoxyphenol hydroxylase-like FAD-dependent oxidoreductase